MCFDWTYSVNLTNFASSEQLWNARLWRKVFLKIRFSIKKLQRVRFKIKIWTTCQTLNQAFWQRVKFLIKFSYSVQGFHSVYLQRLRFWNIFNKVLDYGKYIIFFKKYENFEQNCAFKAPCFDWLYSVIWQVLLFLCNLEMHNSDANVF